MTSTLIDRITFRFQSDDSGNRPGFQLEYSTQNCDDDTNIVCNIGMADIKSQQSYTEEVIHSAIAPY